MIPIPAGVLTAAEAHAASFEGIVIGLLVGSLVLSIGVLFILVKLTVQNAQLEQLVRKALQ